MPINVKNTAQSWTVLFRAFSSHRQPSASLIKGSSQLFFVDFYGFLEMCGVCGMVVRVILRAADIFSSIHSCSEWWLLYQQLSSKNASPRPKPCEHQWLLGPANSYKAFAVALVNVSWREKFELLEVAELTLLRIFSGINTRNPRWWQISSFNLKKNEHLILALESRE